MSEIETTPAKDSKIIDRSEAIKDDQSFFANQSIKTNIARWYAIQVASSCEKKVKATLEQRAITLGVSCLLYTSPSPRDGLLSRMPSSA